MATQHLTPPLPQVNYDIDTRDWQDGGANAKSIYQTILSQHRPATSQWISLAHDVQAFTVHEFARYMIDTARTLGYDLVTVGDCLGDPPANWYRNPATGQAKDARGAGAPPAVLGQSASPSSQQVSSSAAAGGSSSQSSTLGSTSGTMGKASSSVVPTPTAVVSVDFGLGKIVDLTSTTSRTAVAGTGLSITPVGPSSEATVGTSVPSSAGAGMSAAWAGGGCWAWGILVLVLL